MLFDIIGGVLGIGADIVDGVCGDGTTAVVVGTVATVALSPLIAAEEAEKTRKAVEKAAVFNRAISARGLMLAQYIDKNVLCKVFHSGEWYERYVKIINIEIYDNSYSQEYGKEVVIYECKSNADGKIIRLPQATDAFQVVKVLEGQ